MARPTLLTQEVIDQVAAVIGPGIRRKDAAMAVGISEGTYYSWVSRGNRERARMAAHGLDEPSDDELIFVAFLEATEHAWAQAKATALTAIRRAMAGRAASFDQAGRQLTTEQLPEWRAAAWWLERTYPMEYGRHRLQILDPAQHGAAESTDETDIAETMAAAAEEFLRNAPNQAS